MNEIIYQEAIRPFDGMKDIDGAPMVYLTRENNGHALWSYDDHAGTVLVTWFLYESQSLAIRAAVELVDTLRRREAQMNTEVETRPEGCTCGNKWPCPLHGGPPMPAEGAAAEPEAAQ